jgi:hypothetical protein
MGAFVFVNLRCSLINCQIVDVKPTEMVSRQQVIVLQLNVIISLQIIIKMCI